MITNDDKWWLIRVWVLNLGHLNSCIVFYPQPSWVLLFQPMVGAAIHRSLPPVVFCLVHCFNPNSGPPQTQWRAQGRYTKCSWALTMISQWHLEKKTAKAFFVGKVAKLAYGCKRASATCYKPPKVYNGTLPLKPVLPTTWPQKRTKMGESTQVSARPPPLQSMLGHPL